MRAFDRIGRGGSFHEAPDLDFVQLGTGARTNANSNWETTRWKAQSRARRNFAFTLIAPETSQATIHFSGNVVIETESMSIQAEQADMNRVTREFVIGGPLHVRLKYLAVIAGPESLIRY